MMRYGTDIKVSTKIKRYGLLKKDRKKMKPNKKSNSNTVNSRPQTHGVFHSPQWASRLSIPLVIAPTFNSSIPLYLITGSQIKAHYGVLVYLDRSARVFIHPRNFLSYQGFIHNPRKSLLIIYFLLVFPLVPLPGLLRY